MHPEIKSPQKTEVVITEEDRQEALKVFAGASCFADVLHFYYQKNFDTQFWRDLYEEYPAMKGAIEDMLRHLRPWPKWVLRVASEVLHVNLPSIPKDRIEELLNAVHWFFFELRLDGSTPREAFPKPNLNPEILGAMLGHAAAFTEDLPRWIERQGYQPRLTPDLKANLEKYSINNFQREFAPHIARLLEARPESVLSFIKAMSEARENTFDRYGAAKETPLTPVYRQILRRWVEIEKLSGPTELTRVLEDDLNGNKLQDYKNLDRVKMICSRMGITFGRSVK